MTKGYTSLFEATVTSPTNTASQLDLKCNLKPFLYSFHQLKLFSNDIIAD